MAISVTDFSAPIGASVLKFCVHLQVGKVYCVNRNEDAYSRFVFFLFYFFIFEVYRGYIAFAFTVTMSVCLSVCL